MVDFLEKTIANQPSVTFAKPHPSIYGLPHGEWRKNQFETLQWLQNGDRPIRILEASTGSGKTGIATAFSHEKMAISLVQTKLLQTSNYGDSYGWKILFGKGNYECIHPDVDYGTKADSCLFEDAGGMSKCPESGNCPYLLRKHSVMGSPKASLNYSYFLLSRWPKEMNHELIVMDEAHMLSEITLDKAGITIHDKTREEWDLPKFPNISPNNSISLFSIQEPPQDQLKAWLGKSLAILRPKYKRLKLLTVADDKDGQNKLRRLKSLIWSIESALESIEYNDDEWFIESNDQLIFYRGRKIPGLIARPLTAKYHFKNFFIMKPTSLLMSATIGDIETFAEELGIGADEYDFNSVPSIWPPETRPIYDLEAPRMGHRSTQEDYEKQADVIARAIKECPGDWEGVIHVSRKTEAPLLKNRLMKRGLKENRLWIPPQAGTDQQIQAWDQYKKRSTGAIAIAWFWTEGVDLADERICISAKTPFPSLGDPYEKLRQKAYPRMYSQRTAYKLIQSLGRTRRGEEEHYDTNGEKNGMVAIADGNWTRVKNYLSKDILESITKM